MENFLKLSIRIENNCGYFKIFWKYYDLRNREEIDTDNSSLSLDGIDD